MNISLNIKNLKALDKVKSNFIQIKAYENKVYFQKYYKNTSIIINTIAEIKETGEVLIPESVFDTAKKFQDVTFTDEQIISGSRKISFKVPDKFPEKCFVPNELCFVTTERALHRMLEVKYAVAKDDKRPILKGVYFNNNETCALDGYRMSIRKGSYIADVKFVLNISTVEILNNILDLKLNREVKVYYENNYVRFSIDNIDVIGTCLEGDYINYKSVIPEALYTVHVNSDELKSEMEFISGLKSNLINLNFDKDKLKYSLNMIKEELDIEASRKKTAELQQIASEEYRQAFNVWIAKKDLAEKKKKPFKQKMQQERVVKPQKIHKNIPVAAIEGTISCTFMMKFEIAVNPKYLIEAVKQFDNRIDFKLTNRVSPVVLTEDGENLELILPMRVLR